MSWTTLVLVVYLSVLSVLSLQGAHRIWLLWHWLGAPEVPTPPEPETWPRVTVQLPVFNERYVVERLVRAAGLLWYPREKLEIQVLPGHTIVAENPVARF